MKIILYTFFGLFMLFILPAQAQICNQDWVAVDYTQHHPNLQQLLYGFTDSTGQYIPPCKMMSTFNQQGLALVSRPWFERRSVPNHRRDTWGVVNKQGEIIIPIIYQEITTLNDWYKVRKWSTYGILDRTGATLIPLEYQQISSLHSSSDDPLFAVTQEDLQGVVNLKGKIIIPIAYTEIRNFYTTLQNPTPQHTRYKVRLKNGSYQLFNGQGMAIFNATYEDITPLLSLKQLARTSTQQAEAYADLYKVKKRGKYGLIQPNGKVVVPIIYNQIALVNHSAYSRALEVEKNGQWGVLSLSNKVLVPTAYEAISCFECVFFELNFQGLFFQATKNGKLGLVNAQHQIIVPFAYDEIRSTYFERSPIDSIIYAVRQGQQWGLVNSQGQPLTAVIFEAVTRFRNGLLAIKRDGKWGFINRQGIEVIPPKYDAVEAFSSSETHVRKGGKSFWIDRKGKIVR